MFTDKRGLEKPTSLANVANLGDRIRRARRQAGLSQAVLAHLTGVSASAVSQWEHPYGTQPDIDRVLRIAIATGVSLDWLIAGDESKASSRLAPRPNPQVGDETPAVALDAYARDILEERLLERFRNLSISARELIDRLMHEIGMRPKHR